MEDGARWWLRYLRVFALNTPFGLPVKFTIGVTAYDGERLAKAWRMTPYDVVDAHGRACKQIQAEGNLIAIEWLVPDPPKPSSGNPVTWGGKSSDDPDPRSRYRRNERGALELKKD